MPVESPRVSSGKNSHAWRRVVAPQPPCPGRDLTCGEGQYTVGDVGVVAFHIRVRVVTVMLADPPAEAEADEQVAGRLTEQVIAPAGREDLQMTPVVT